MLANSDLFVVSEKYNIYLKETNKLLIKIYVPSFKNSSSKVISNWEILEKIHSIIRPFLFLQLKVISNSIEEIKLEGEVQDNADISKIVKILENKRMKISGFSDSFTLTASVFSSDQPNKHDWNHFFGDHYEHNKPGDRPDTLHIKGLPTLWFSEKTSNKPSQVIVDTVFSRFGKVRAIYIPITNPMFRDCSGAFGSIISMCGNAADSATTLLTFEAFIQYKTVLEFCNAVTILRNKKLVFKDVKIDSLGLPMDSWFNAEIVLDFDRGMHLSENSIYKRDAAIKSYYSRLLEEAEKTRREEEAILEKIKRHDMKRKKLEDERKRKIKEQAGENKRLEIQKQFEMDQRNLLIAQRNVESIRLLSALLDIVKSKEESEILRTRELELECARQKLLAEERSKLEAESKESDKRQKRKKEELLKKELELRTSLMKKLRQQSYCDIPFEVEQCKRSKY